MTKKIPTELASDHEEFLGWGVDFKSHFFFFANTSDDTVRLAFIE